MIEYLSLSFRWMIAFWKTVMTNLDSVLKSKGITLPTKVSLVKAMVFPVVMAECEELDHKESWALKNWCFWTVVLEKTLESPLGCKEIKPVHPKGNQSWIFIGRTEAEAPILWPPDAKSWLIGKAPDAGKGWRREEQGMTEDEMVGWHHWLDGHEFEQTPGDSEGQGSLACCSPWGCRVRRDLQQQQESLLNTQHRSYSDLLGQCIWQFSAVCWALWRLLGNFPERIHFWSPGLASALTSPCALGWETLCSQDCGLREFYFWDLNTAHHKIPFPWNKKSTISDGVLFRKLLASITRNK